MEMSRLKNILEAILLAADRTLTVIHLESLFELDEERPTRDEIRQALHEMADDYATRGYELKQVASGFRLQVRQEYATWVGRLWEERPARYTRALLETMALIAYRQPITRGEIEEVRGVSVSSNIIKTLLERDWIKVLGHKDVPGKPTLYGTTKEFLDYFNLKTLDQLPTLSEIKDLDSIHPELELDEDLPDESNDENSDTESFSAEDASVEESDNDNSSASSVDGDVTLNEDASVEENHTEEIVETNESEELSSAVAASAADDFAVDDAEDSATEVDISEEMEEVDKKAFNV